MLIPARKKFLRSKATEFRHIHEIFLAHAVANPQIHLELIHNSKGIFNLPSTQDITTRVFDIWGKNTSDQTHKIAAEGPSMSISGLIGHPSIAKTNRNIQYLTLNRRPILSPLIRKAIEDAYYSNLPERHYPVFLLDLSIKPQEVDINVHPRKLEVKFENTGQIFAYIKNTISKALEQFEKKSLTDSFTSLSKPRSTSSNWKKTKAPNTPTKTLTHNLVAASMRFSKELMESPERLNEKLDTEYKAIQLFFNYILIEESGKLIFIDQHAADERVRFEKLLADIEATGQLPIQRLALPEVIELDKASTVLINENKAELAKIGLDLDVFSSKSIKINTVPAAVKGLNIQNFIEEYLASMTKKTSRKELYYETLASLACHSSIRAGERLSNESMNQIIKDLFVCKKPYSCPHGRPVIWELRKNDLDKEFKRTGF